MLLLGLLAMAAAPARAQIGLPPVQVPNVPVLDTQPLNRTVNGVLEQADPERLRELRQLRIRSFLSSRSCCGSAWSSTPLTVRFRGWVSSTGRLGTCTGGSPICARAGDAAIASSPSSNIVKWFRNMSLAYTWRDREFFPPRTLSLPKILA